MGSRNELRISVAGSGGLTGVPQHSDLEPDCWLAKRAAICASQRRITAENLRETGFS